MTPYILNLTNLLFTLYAINHGIPEANPLMRNPAVMVVYKVVVIGVLCWWLRRRQETIAVVGRHLLTAVYAALNVWHIYNLFLR